MILNANQISWVRKWGENWTHNGGKLPSKSASRLVLGQQSWNYNSREGVVSPGFTQFMNLTEIKLPTSLICPACNHPLRNASLTRGATNQQVQKGLVVLCSSCTSVLQLGDSGLRLMTPDQINALVPASKAAILATRKVLQQVLENGKTRPIIK